MKMNKQYRNISKERRQYRKYAPWIFFLAEMILIIELLYSTSFFVSLGHISVIIFIAAVYYRLNKLFYILKRQKPLNKDVRRTKKSRS